ncbi:putative acetylcholine receptor chaperone [Saccoglossus kowalevskii]|uniref:Novel acetylcholine receptor chaperone n=1 Tax=Saccoglossus kowalevskii TaxID=10224 RepID=A0ABM0M0Y0_SACKO|nr:PREDICTED: transmembrane protein 35-like [Saccoglossus kowalevskii]
MASNVLIALSIAIGIFFVFTGSLKVTPALNKQIHDELRKDFGKYARDFPLRQYTGWKPKSKLYMKTIGWFEVICGAVLVFLPSSKLKNLANLILLGIITGAIYTHHIIGDPIAKSTGAIIFWLLLVTRFIIAVKFQPKERKLKSR